MKKTTLTCDIFVCGAGPAGLCFARALADSGLSVVMAEKQPEKILASPPPDGRDTALTHLSAKLLRDLGLWQKVPAKEIAPIKEARVLNGTSPRFLQFQHEGTGKDRLGSLIPNDMIRRAAYQAVKPLKNVTLLTGVEVKDLKADAKGAVATLADGRVIRARLAVAADSRVSPTRAMMGIKTAMKDFKRTVIVCRMTHAKPHHRIAHECFHYGRTLAVLPLNGNLSSIIVTLPSDEAQGAMAQSSAAFAADIQKRFENRLGKMQLVGERHSYPLAGTYPETFIASRFALLGDAAVGMHPVTAHGFNFGLRGAVTLAQTIMRAHRLGLDIGSATVLSDYDRAHRRATLALYHGTNVIVGLFTDDRRPARIARDVLLMLSNRVTPAKRLITAQLTELPKIRAF